MKLFFIYKFTIKGTGFYYFGVTCDIDIRKRDHISKLNRTILALKLDRELYKRKDHEGYFKVAKDLIRGKRPYSIGKRIAESVCLFEVLDIKECPREAAHIETRLIRNNIGLFWCFNRARYSCYSGYRNRTKIKHKN